MAKNKQKSRRMRIVLWSLAMILGGALLLPLAGYMAFHLTSGGDAVAQESGATQGDGGEIGNPNPRANFWSAVRDGNEGYVAAQGPYTVNTLIQNGGQNWRQYRNGPIATYGPWLLAAVLVAIALFHIFTRGGVRIEAKRSGLTVPRWSSFERFLHWLTAALFIILAITGLSLLFGKAVLIPVLGSRGFAGWASIAITLHNYLGPLFVVGIFLEIVLWIRHNIPNAADLQWFAKGGGLIGKSHPSAGRMNGGEKLWFWIIATVGVAVCVTGIVLDFPNFGFSREDMQLASLIHAICSIIWVAVAIGHIYIGTLGTEGSLEGMTTGRVSVEWAEQHHDQWYAEVKDSAEDTGQTAAPEGQTQTSG